MFARKKLKGGHSQAVVTASGTTMPKLSKEGVRRSLMTSPYAVAYSRQVKVDKESAIHRVFTHTRAGPNRLGNIDDGSGGIIASPSVTRDGGLSGYSLFHADNFGTSRISSIADASAQYWSVSPLADDAFFSVMVNPFLDVGKEKWTEMQNKFHFWRVGAVTVYIQMWPFNDDANGNFPAILTDTDNPPSGATGEQVRSSRVYPGWRTGKVKFYWMPEMDSFSDVTQNVYNWVRSGDQRSNSFLLGNNTGCWLTPYVRNNKAWYDWNNGGKDLTTVTAGGNATGMYFRPWTYVKDAKADSECWKEYMASHGRSKMLSTPAKGWKRSYKMTFPAAMSAANWVTSDSKSFPNVMDLDPSLRQFWGKTDHADVITGNSPLRIGVGLLRLRGSRVKFRIKVKYDVFFNGAKCKNFEQNAPEPYPVT